MFKKKQFRGRPKKLLVLSKRAEELKKLRRNHKKQFHEVLNGIALQWLDQKNVVFFVTVSGLNKFGDVEKVWKLWTDTLYKEIIKLFVGLNLFCWGLGVTEKHLEKDLESEKDTLDSNSLEGYPHGHFVVCIQKDSFLSKKANILAVESILHQCLTKLDLDFDLKYVTATKTAYKGLLVYCLKDQKSRVREKLYTKLEQLPVWMFDKKEYGGLEIYVQWLIHYFQEQKVEVKQELGIVDVQRNPVYEDDFASFICFVKDKLREGAFLLYKGGLYQKQHTCTYLLYETQGHLIGFHTFLIKLDDKFVFNFVNKYWSSFVKTYQQGYFLDDEAFIFQYIELQDCVWDLKTNIFVEKRNDFRAFKYLDITKQYLLSELGINTFKRVLWGLPSLNLPIVNDQHFFKLFYFLYAVGRCILVNKGFGKECKHIYMSGRPSSGKSTIVEKFYTWLFGSQQIGIIGKGNFQLETVLDKRVIIVNEFKHKDVEREITLKLLDASLLFVQKKHEKNVAGKIEGLFYFISNFSMEEQNMDEALISRLESFDLVWTFEELIVDYEDLVKEFPYVLYLSLWTFLKYKEVPVYWKNISKGEQTEFVKLFRKEFAEVQSETISPNCVIHELKKDLERQRILFQKPQFFQRLRDKNNLFIKK